MGGPLKLQFENHLIKNVPLRDELCLAGYTQSSVPWELRQNSYPGPRHNAFAICNVRRARIRTHLGDHRKISAPVSVQNSRLELGHDCPLKYGC